MNNTLFSFIGNRHLHSACCCPPPDRCFSQGTSFSSQAFIKYALYMGELLGSRRKEQGRRYGLGFIEAYSPRVHPFEEFGVPRTTKTSGPPKSIRQGVQERKKSYPPQKVSSIQCFIGKGSPSPMSHLQLLSLVLLDQYQEDQAKGKTRVEEATS